MSTVCKWLSGFCVWENPKKTQHQVHPDQQTFDAIIIWREKAKESTGGVAYDVILKPAAADLAPRPASPPKERALTQEDIENKLKEAQARRESLEANKLQQIAKERARAEEVLQKAQEDNVTFSKITQQKLRRSMELNKENRETQIKALQERLREHRLKVQEVCKNSDKVSKELEDKINHKFEQYEENRKIQLQVLLARLKEHDKHCKEVNKTCEEMYKASEEKIEEKMLQKMESAYRNREESLKQLLDRLQEHERRINDVRRNKISSQENEQSPAES